MVKTKAAPEVPTKNLALDLVRVTEAAALSSARWLGKGEKEAGDRAAVDAMRLSFNSMAIKGTVIIGEGEKDKSPMLYNGEIVGNTKLVATADVEPSNILTVLDHIKNIISRPWFTASVIIFIVLFAIYIAVSLIRRGRRERKRFF